MNRNLVIVVVFLAVALALIWLAPNFAELMLAVAAVTAAFYFVRWLVRHH